MKYLVILLLLASCGKNPTDKPGVMVYPPTKIDAPQNYTISHKTRSISEFGPAKRNFNPYRKTLSQK